MTGTHTNVVFTSSLADVLAYLRGTPVPPVAVILEARDAMGRATLAPGQRSHSAQMVG